MYSRRKFVGASLALVGASQFIASKTFADQAPMTIAQIIDMIKQSIMLDTAAGTVDTVKSGNTDQPVRGIITTMFATVDVIRRAISSGANLIIAHEPTFYNHLDETSWLKDHEVFRLKNELLTKNNIVVWRFHDYLHANKPDGVLMGVLTKLGWDKYYNAQDPTTIILPGLKLADVISLAKRSLGIETLRYIGDALQVVKKVAVLPGAWGGRRHMQVLHGVQPDLLICGELQEWETSEYVRDLRAFGKITSLIVLGHAVSEEPGMEWMVSWLQKKIPGTSITHIPSGNPFSFA
jgi:putative NIF3 family GTP cyclohydrolase 1 type 2